MTPPRHWQNAAIAVITMAAVLTLSGCNMLQSSKPSTNNGGTQAAGHVGLSAAVVSFGGVAVGSSKTSHLTLTNSTAAGGPDVTVSQITAGGTGYSTTNTASVDLKPGQTLDIAIVFKPTAAGLVYGSLTIDVVGTTDPATVTLSGTGTSASNPAEAQLSVSPATVAFGSVNVGSSKNMTGTLQASNADVTISSAAWNGGGYTMSGITFPVTIAAGSSKSFTVSFAPQSAGSANGNVSFVSNAANSPTTESFTGTGAQAPVQHTVSLNWVPSTSTVTGYNVYRANQSGGPYARLNGSLRTSVNYSDSSVQSGHTYFYVATAVDSSSQESAYSAEVAAFVPSP